MTSNDLKKSALGVLLKNRKKGYSNWAKTRYEFSCPSVRTYPYQWFWDSCFHVIALSRLDQELAKKELVSLLSVQKEDGFIPHVIFWDRGILKPKPWRYSQSAGWMLRPKYTGMIQPPVLGLSVETLYRATRDKVFLAKVLPQVESYYEWLERHRDPDRDHLISIITPYESGLDYAPHFDEVVDFHAKDTNRRKLARLETKYRRLDLQNKIHGYNSDNILALDYFNVEDVMVNTIYAASLKSIAMLFSEIGEHATSARFEKKGREVARAILTKCYDPRSGLYFSLSGRSEKKLKTKTFVSLMPLLLDEISKTARKNLIEGHLLNQNEFWLPYPIPIVAASEPTFDPEENHFIWRGPSWINSNWFIVKGLQEQIFSGR